MSSSWGNTINIFDEPRDMFGKVMSLRDDLMERYFLLATRLPVTKITEYLAAPNPRDAKLFLAETIVMLYHGKEKGMDARNAFLAQFSKKEIPDEIESVSLSPGNHSVFDILFENKLVESKSDARRLLKQNAIKLDGNMLSAEMIQVEKGASYVVQAGKRRFVKIVGK